MSSITTKQRQLAASLFSILGFGIFLWITRNYPLIITGMDGVSYLQGARNLLHGHGFTLLQGNGNYELIPYWPPLYSFTLASFSFLTGIECLDAARYLAAILFGGALFLFNGCLNKAKVSTPLQLALNFVLLFSPAFTEFYSLASESLFIFLMLLHTFFFITYIETGKRKHLFASGLLAAFFLLTRYAGVGFMIGTSLCLYLQPESLKEKVYRIAHYLFLPVLFIGCWLIYKSLYPVILTDRHIQLHLVSLRHLERLAGTLLYWISPVLRMYLGPVISLLLAILMYQQYQLHKSVTETQRKLLRFLLLTISTYLIFLVVIISVYDFSPTFDNRMLSPLYPLLLIAAGIYFKEFPNKKLAGTTLGVVLFTGILFFGSWTNNQIQNGEGYTGRDWKNSALIADLKNKPPSGLVYTNGEFILPFLTNKAVGIFPLPSKFSSHTLMKNEKFDSEMAEIKNKIRRGEAELIYFNQDKRYFLPDARHIQSAFSDCHIRELADGFIIGK